MSVSICLNTVASLLQEVECILQPSFGPHGLHNLVFSATGKVIISRDGWTTLDALHLSHPIIRVVTSAIGTHYNLTGDQSKSFILMVTECLRLVRRRFEQFTCKEDGQRHLLLISKGCGTFVNNLSHTVLLPELMKHVSCTRPSLLNIEHLKNTCCTIVKTTLNGRVTKSIARQMSCILVDFVLGLCSDRSELLDVILLVIDHFNLLCISAPNLPFGNTAIVKGIIIQKDFALNCSLDKGNQLPPVVKFVLVDCSLEGAESESSVTYMSRGGEQVDQAVTWKMEHCLGIFKVLASQGINLILSTHLVSNLVKSVSQSYSVSIVQALSQEDMSYISMLTKVEVVDNPLDVTHSNCIGKARFCKPIICGSQRYIHLGVDDQLHISPRHLVLCAPTETVSRQYTASLLSAVKSLRMWLFNPPCEYPQETMHQHNPHCDYPKESMCGKCPSSECAQNTIHGSETKYDLYGLTVEGGGKFELLVYHCLSSYMTSCSDSSILEVCSLLQQMVLSIPKCLHSNKYTTNTDCQRFPSIPINSKNTVAGTVNIGSAEFLPSSPTHCLEPFYAKYQLLVNVVQLIQLLFRIV